MNRGLWYLGANLAYILLVIIGASLNDNGVHPLYLLALFALCSTPILHLRRLNDRHALPALFFATYFMYFGLLDLQHLLAGVPGPRDTAWMSPSELLIVAGAACAYAGNLAAGRIWRTTPEAGSDWPEGMLTAVGVVLWLVCTWLTWRFKTEVVIDTIVENQQAGLARVGALMAEIYILATYLQPLGILILAYAQARYRRPWMLPVLGLAVAAQFAIGFVEDSKGDAVIGMAIVLLTRALTEGKLPWRWLLGAVLFISLAWPVMQANRFVRERYALTHADVAAHPLQTLQRAIEAKSITSTGPDRVNSFFERASLKGSVEMIVDGTAHGIPFQDGYTLSPLVTIFIPRLLWPDKPDVQTGLLMNKVFSVVPDAPETYISPSHLGELYWNFGWPGSLAGMLLLGFVLGYFGTRFELADAATLTRVMVVVITIRQIVLGFESAIAPEYSMWIRSLLMIGLLHLLLARRSAGAAEEPAPAAAAAGLEPVPLFPNLMR